LRSTVAGPTPSRCIPPIKRARFSVGGDFSIRTLSALNLDRQVGSDGAAWLGRELVAKDHLPIADAGFGQEVNTALGRRAARLVEIGYAT
jgi:hypothetical protein